MVVEPLSSRDLSRTSARELEAARIVLRYCPDTTPSSRGRYNRGMPVKNPYLHGILTISAFNCEIRLADIFAGIEFPPPLRPVLRVADNDVQQ